MGALSIGAGRQVSQYQEFSNVDTKIFGTVFLTVFIAELGDKTQMATMLYAAEKRGQGLTVFAASALALVLSSALGVLVGTLLSSLLNPKVISWVAGIAFVGIGIWILVGAARQ